MPFAVIKLPNEPIVIVVGAIPLEEHIEPMRSVMNQLDHLARQFDRPLYCLLDARHLDDLSYSDILLWLEEQRLVVSGTIRDPRLRPIGVGTHDLLPIAAKKARQMFGVTVPVFATLEEALAAVRAELHPD